MEPCPLSADDGTIHFPADRFRIHGYQDFDAACDLKGDLYGKFSPSLHPIATELYNSLLLAVVLILNCLHMKYKKTCLIVFHLQIMLACWPHQACE